MTAETAVPIRESRRPGGPPRRQLRNYLLDPRFQMKYVSMVVGVTVVVAGVLGYFAYRYSTGQTEMMTMMQVEQRAKMDSNTLKFINDEAAKADRTVLIGILVGILCLTLSLGLTGIVVTHKLVGPAYKIKRLLGDVRDGRLKVEGRLRKGDELVDVFEAFEEMVKSLRAAQQKEIEQLESAIERARESGVPDEAIQHVIAVKEQMKRELE